jgi:hypothetical protein
MAGAPLLLLTLDSRRGIAKLSPTEYLKRPIHQALIELAVVALEPRSVLDHSSALFGTPKH